MADEIARSIMPVNIEDEMRQSYMDYAMSVIVGRALPDVRGPGTVNFDLSLIKDTFIGERLNVQFRAEAFNFLNHVNLGGRSNAPNTAFRPGADGLNSSATFGTITAARDARVVQFGLKVIF